MGSLISSNDIQYLTEAYHNGTETSVERSYQPAGHRTPLLWVKVSVVSGDPVWRLKNLIRVETRRGQTVTSQYLPDPTYIKEALYERD